MTTRSNSGIYAIINVVNGKVYIGSTTNFETRWKDYREDLIRGSHGNSYLQRSWDKYGRCAFVFMICEYIDSFKCLKEREQYWLDFHRMCAGVYNIALVIESPMLGRKHTKESRLRMSEVAMGHGVSEESRQKMSESAKGNQNALGCTRSKEQRRNISEGLRNMPPEAKVERLRKISEAGKGRVFTEEHCRKLSESKMGHFVSEETRYNMSEAQKLRHSVMPVSEETKRRIGDANRGHVHTEEAKRKMSKAAKAYWARVRADRGA